MFVRLHMVRDVLCATEADPARSALEVMQRHAFRQMPVTRDDRLVGLVTESDLLRILPGTPQGLEEHAQGDGPELRVAHAMSSQPPTLGPNDGIDEAARLLLRTRAGALVVVEDERVVGILSRTDLLGILDDVISRTDGRRVTFLMGAALAAERRFDPVLECIKRGVRVVGLVSYRVPSGSRVVVLHLLGRAERVDAFLDAAVDAGCVLLGNGRRAA